MPRLPHPAVIVLVVIAVLMAGVAIILESGIPRYVAQSVASAKLGRSVSMSQLEIDVIPRPRVEIRDLKIANFEGGSTENMVELARGEVVIDGWKLLTGKIDVPRITVERPVLVLEKNEKGEGNWQFGDQEEPAAVPEFQIDKLAIQQGRVAYRDPSNKIDVGITVNSQPGENGAERLALEGSGTIATTDFKLNGRADTVLNLQNKEQPYAAELEIVQGDNRARLAGSLKEPLRFEGLAADIHLEAKSAYDLYQLTGIAIPPTPPYTLDGKLFHDGNVWRMEPVIARVGKSDLRGEVTFDAGGERPKLDADLTSQHLNIPDLGGFAGEKGEKKETGVQQVQRETEQKRAQGQQTREPPKADNTGPIIPDTEIDFGQLKVMDAHVRFRGTRVESPIVPVTEVATEVTLENGLLRVKPLRFGIGEGKIDLIVALDGRRKPAAFETAINVTRVPLGEILQSVEKKLQQRQTSVGTIGGRLEIKGQGNSPKALLASSNGHLGLAMQQGQIGQLLIELIGLDAAESLGVVLSGNKPVPLRCFIADFEVIDGIMGSKTFVIDTTDTNIVGEGAINFKTEQVNFRLVPYPKDFTVFSTRSPIRISGPLNDIGIRPEAAPLAARLGIAAALSAVLTPLAAPLAFLDTGLGKDSDCAAFVQEVRARIEEHKGEEPRSGTSGNPRRPSNR